MKDKSKASAIFKKFPKLIQNVLQSSIQSFELIMGVSIFSMNLSNIFVTMVCIYSRTNGIVERENLHLLEVACSVMFASHGPNSFWCEAIVFLCCLINRLPFKSLQFRTPLSVLLEFFSQVRFLNSLQPKVFGCTIFEYDHSPARGKLDSRVIKCVYWVFPY